MFFAVIVGLMDFGYSSSILWIVLKMASIRSSCVDNDLFISFNCICCSFNVLSILFLKSSMTFMMFS